MEGSSPPRWVISKVMMHLVEHLVRNALPSSFARWFTPSPSGRSRMCHACARGRCRQEQQKEMQEHKDKQEMQDEMASQEAGAGGRC